MSEFIVGARGHDFGRHSVEELLCSIGDAGFRCTQLAYTKAVEGVNVTLGLPIIRASVDHGTDFYHAGKGNGNELSLVNAIKYAVKMTGREA